MVCVYKVICLTEIFFVYAYIYDALFLTPNLLWKAVDTVVLEVAVAASPNHELYKKSRRSRTRLFLYLRFRKLPLLPLFHFGLT